MTKMLSLTNRFLTDEEGAALVEYTVLTGILLVTIMAAILSIGDWVGVKWTNLNSALYLSP